MKTKRKQGFSLIEMVIVIVVLGICLAPIGVLFNNVMAKYAVPQTMQIAVGLAEQETERVTSLRFSTISNASGALLPGYSYQVVVTPVPTSLADDPGMSKYKQVEVKILHNLIGSVNIITVVSKKDAV